MHIQYIDNDLYCRREEMRRDQRTEEIRMEVWEEVFSRSVLLSFLLIQHLLKEFSLTL